MHACMWGGGAPLLAGGLPHHRTGTHIHVLPAVHLRQEILLFRRKVLLCLLHTEVVVKSCWPANSHAHPVGYGRGGLLTTASAMAAFMHASQKSMAREEGCRGGLPACSRGHC